MPFIGQNPSVGAYNILEDDIISTKASKESLNTDISLNAAKFVLDKVYLFMRKQWKLKIMKLINFA